MVRRGSEAIDPGRRRAFLAWFRSVAFTIGLSGLVAVGIADRGDVFPMIAFLAASASFALLYTLFPGGVNFAFGTANGFAVYACLYTVLGRSGFPEAPGWARAPAFLLPIFAFLVAVWWRREALKRVAEAGEPIALDHLSRMARWLVLVSLVAVLCLTLPVNRMSGANQGIALLVAMGTISVVVMASVEGVVRFLTDIAVLIDDLGQRAGRLVIPVATFLSIYSLNVIVFACLYRIADGLSRVALFHGPDGPLRLEFGDALHFSIVTISTVGYGDIRPHDDGIRLLTAAEVLVGQVLLLFGFAEIMRSRRIRFDDSHETNPRPLDPVKASGHSAGQMTAETKARD